MKLRVYKIFFVLLIVLVCIIIFLISIKYINRNLIEIKNREVVETFSKGVATVNGAGEIKMNGYKVIGIVKIPKIQIEYPILDIETYNPEETKEPMKISVVKYWGENVNDFGNLSIAGHNNYNGTMFGKIKYLENGDIIQLTDLSNQTVEYFIKDIFVTDPNDVSVLQTTNKTVREVTLITCINGNNKRLILKAVEIV